MAFVLEGGLVWHGLPDEAAGAGVVTIDGARIVDAVTPGAAIERIAVPGCTSCPA